MEKTENRVNYQKELDRIIENIEKSGHKPRLLLHSCCAPCSSYVLSYLKDYFEIIILYYNPNITDKEEFDHRHNELVRLVNEMGLQISFVPVNYDSKEFLDAVKGFEKEKEGGKRCRICFNLRLEEAARAAREYEADYFCTTLSISPLKNSALLNEIGQEMAEKYGVSWLPSDFKKRGGYQASIELSKLYNLYRQDYCGCIFSKAERESSL